MSKFKTKKIISQFGLARRKQRKHAKPSAVFAGFLSCLTEGSSFGASFSAARAQIHISLLWDASLIDHKLVSR